VRVHWTHTAIQHLLAIHEHIARDAPLYAQRIVVDRRITSGGTREAKADAVQRAEGSNPGGARASVQDTTDLLAWLRREMLPQDPDEAHVQDYALAWYRERRIKPLPPYRLSSSG